MALIVDYRTDMGKVVRTIDGKSCTINIHTCNALAAFIYHFEEKGKAYASLMMFYMDDTHMRRCFANNDRIFGEGERIKRIELNLYYPNAKKMLNEFVKHGYKVTAYYKAPAPAPETK